MVFYHDLFWAERMMEARVAEALRRRQELRWQRFSQGGPQEGPVWRTRRLLGRVALLLVALGARLVQYGLPPHCPFGNELKRGNPSATVA